MATRSNAPPKPHLGFGTRIRKSPFFESTLAWGCKEYTTYNHMYFPVYYNNKIVGVVTSGGYGFRTKKSLAFAYVRSDLANGGNFEIEIQGQKRKAKILNQVVYDPDNQRLRA